MSAWTATWRGWGLLISAVEIATDVPAEELPPAGEVDLFAEDLRLSEQDMVALQTYPRLYGGPAIDPAGLP